MADAWNRGARDASRRSPLQGGEPPGQVDDQGERRDRHIRVGISHPSDNPARHRVFAVRASHDAAIGGWVARVGEENLNEKLAAWGARQRDERGPRAFPTPAACLGDAVAALVDLVDRETEGES